MRTYILPLFCGVFLCVQCTSDKTEKSSTIAVIPQPISVTPGEKEFVIDKNTVLHINHDDVFPVADYLSGMLSASSTFTLAVKTGNETSGEKSIVLRLDETLDKATDYELTVNPEQVLIRAATAEGVFHGVQTLRQLLPASVEKKDKQTARWILPGVVIQDKAAYPWRGMHLDVSRHFFSVDFIKTFIDRMALYKFNKLHLHLTDDQGWRLQIEKYPQLTEQGAWRVLNGQDSVCLKKAETNPDFALPQEFFKTENGKRFYGGYYSKEDINDIVTYAAQRFVTIVPEIDMPGHMNAAIESFPHLTCTDQPGWGKLFSVPLCPCEESTYTFIEDIIAEVAALFPGEYIHIGADEVDESTWSASAACRALVKSPGTKSTKELHSYFVNRVNQIVSKYNKKAIGWDEIIDGRIDSSLLVMYWRGWVKDAPLRAAQNGNKIIMSPTSHCYFDYEPDHKSLEWMYSFQPVPEALKNDDVRKIEGVQANIWTEYIPTVARLDYMTMPRMIALAEVGWSMDKNWDDFSSRIQTHYARWDEMKIRYRLPDLPGLKEHVVFTGNTQLKLSVPSGVSEIRYTTDGTEPDEKSRKYERPLPVDSTMTVKLLTLANDKRKGNRYTIRFEKQDYLAPVENVTTVPGLACQYYEKGYSSVNRISKNDLKHEAVVANISIPAFTRQEVFALVFEGFIEVPQTGIYTFYLSSDDGSSLMIGNREVINNDGYHGDREVSGQVALSKGKHPFMLKYFDGGGGNSLRLQYETPQEEKQDVPDNFFSRRKD